MLKVGFIPQRLRLTSGTDRTCRPSVPNQSSPDLGSVSLTQSVSAGIRWFSIDRLRRPAARAGSAR